MGGSREIQLMEVQASQPEWTDSNTHDPGITLLEFIGYLLEDLLFSPLGGAMIAAITVFGVSYAWRRRRRKKPARVRR